MFFFYQFLTTPTGLCIYIGPLACVYTGRMCVPPIRQARSDRKLKSQFRGRLLPPAPGEQLHCRWSKENGRGKTLLFKCDTGPLTHGASAGILIKSNPIALGNPFRSLASPYTPTNEQYKSLDFTQNYRAI